jgi:anaphase-promoting complex subunit 2
VWPFLKTVLENITSLTFQRIQSLLKLTVPKEKVDLNIIESSLLEEYLDWLVDENRLDISNGNYKLR